MFNKVFNAFLVVLFGLDLFSAGAAFADNNTASGTQNLVTAGLWGAILLMNFAVYANRERRLGKILRESMEQVDKHIRRDIAERKLADERKNSQKAKTESVKASPSRSKKAGARPTGNRAKKVPTVKKGV